MSWWSSIKTAARTIVSKITKPKPTPSYTITVPPKVTEATGTKTYTEYAATKGQTGVTTIHTGGGGGDEVSNGGGGEVSTPTPIPTVITKIIPDQTITTSLPIVTAEKKPKAIVPYTTKMKVVDILKYYKEKFFDLFPDVPEIKETKVSPFVHEFSQTGTQGTLTTRMRTVEEMPPEQAYESKVEELQTKAFIGGIKYQEELQSKVSEGKIGIEAAQEEMNVYLKDVNEKMKESQKKLQSEYAVSSAKYFAPYTFITGAVIGGISALAPPIGYTYLAGTVGKAVTHLPEIAESYAISPKAFWITTGTFAAGAAIGGLGAGKIKASYLKSQLMKDLKIAKIKLIGKEYVKKQGVSKIKLIGETTIRGKKIRIVSEQLIKQIGGKGSVGEQTIQVIFKEKGGYRILGYKGLSSGKLVSKPSFIKQFKGLATKQQLEYGFKGIGKIKPTYDVFLKSKYYLTKGEMGGVGRGKYYPTSQFGKPFKFGGVKVDVGEGFYYLKGGEARAIRVYKKGGISEIYKTNIEALIKRVKPSTGKEFFSFKGSGKKSSQLYFEKLYQTQLPTVSQAIKISGEKIVQVETKQIIPQVTISKIKSTIKTPTLQASMFKAFSTVKPKEEQKIGIISKEVFEQPPKLITSPKFISVAKLKGVQRGVSIVISKTAQAQINEEKQKMRYKFDQSTFQPSKFIFTPSFKIPVVFHIPSLKSPYKRTKRKKVVRVRFKQPKKYQPTYAARALGIKAVKIPKGYKIGAGGIISRPIIRKKKKKKK